MADMTWMTQKRWTVSSIQPLTSNFIPGVATTDIVSFDLTQNQIFRTLVNSQTLVNSSVANPGATVAWGTWDQVFTNGVSGVTSSGDETFRITWDGAGHLTCELWPNPPGFLLGPVVVGTALGALVGAIVGRVAANPRVGLFAGTAAALVGSLASAAASTNGVSTTSSGTWIANDGSSGGGTGTVGKPGDGQDPQIPRPARIA